MRGEAPAVELYSITGEGHEWPGGPPLPRSLTTVLGPQSDAVDANAVMWAFFSAYALYPGPCPRSANGTKTGLEHTP